MNYDDIIILSEVYHINLDYCPFILEREQNVDRELLSYILAGNCPTPYCIEWNRENLLTLADTYYSHILNRFKDCIRKSNWSQEYLNTIIQVFLQYKHWKALHSQIVIECVYKGADISLFKDPLSIAIECKDTEFFFWCINKGIKPCRGINIYICNAYKYGLKDIVEYFINLYSDFGVFDIIFEEIRHTDGPILQLLIDRCKNVEQVYDADKRQLLLASLKLCNYATSNKILSTGVPIEEADLRLYKSISIDADNVDSIKLLIENGLVSPEDAINDSCTQDAYKISNYLLTTYPISQQTLNSILVKALFPTHPSEKQVAFVKLLIHVGADVNSLDDRFVLSIYSNMYKKPFKYILTESGYDTSKIVKLLLE